eukprot:3934909-Rhodomonas_salina.1
MYIRDPSTWHYIGRRNLNEIRLRSSEPPHPPPLRHQHSHGHHQQLCHDPETEPWAQGMRYADVIAWEEKEREEAARDTSRAHLSGRAKRAL